MIERVVQQPTFVLHTRPFRDTSLLVDLWTRDYGRIGGVARGARAQKSRYRGYLRPFVPMLVGWSGRSELVSFNQIEADGSPMLLEGRALLAGMYLNELLVRLLHQHDPHTGLFDHYRLTLSALNERGDIEPILRRFEKALLIELGFGFSWTQASDTFAPIVSSQWYHFEPDLGFCEQSTSSTAQPLLSGAHLLSIAENDFSTPEILRAAKHIMRRAMQVRLGSRVIKTRELFT